MGIAIQEEPKLSYPLDTQSTAGICRQLNEVLDGINSGKFETIRAVYDFLATIKGIDGIRQSSPEGAQLLDLIDSNLQG